MKEFCNKRMTYVSDRECAECFRCGLSGYAVKVICREKNIETKEEEKA